MVKFDDSRTADYSQLEGLIIDMILNHLPSQASRARPIRKPSYDSTFGSATFTSYSNPFRESSASTLAISDSPLSKRYSTSQPSSGYQLNGDVHASFYQSLKAALSHATGSDLRVPTDTIYMDGESDNLRGKKTDSQTTRINTDDDRFKRLKFCDTVFIIDDTGSMAMPVREDEPDGPNRWEVTKNALGHVAEIAAMHAEDGIDIRFLKAEEFDEDSIRSGERVEEILDNIDVADEHHGGGTGFLSQLESVIRKHLHNYEDYVEEMAEFNKKSKGRSSMHAPPKEPKFLNVFVITDGQADDEEEVEEFVVKVAKKLDKIDAPKNCIGVQFVQVGDDKRATRFLQRLDDELKTQGTRDVSFPCNFFFSFVKALNVLLISHWR